MGNPFWPLFDLVVRTPHLELRPPDDAMCVELARSADLGMFPDGEIHFRMDWISLPSPLRERQSMQWWWSQRAKWSADDWSLALAVIVDGRPVGIQDMAAQSFPARRSVTTGSWLSAPAQGHGYGREMRQAILHLAFVGLGAKEALSEAFVANERSIRVSRGAGYEDNGRHIDLRAGRTPTEVRGFRITRERFLALELDGFAIENLHPCLEMFGLDQDLEPLPAPEPANPPSPDDAAAPARAPAPANLSTEP